MTSNDNFNRLKLIARSGVVGADVQWAVEEIERLRRELWAIAECIYRNESAAVGKHWAEGIIVQLRSGDAAPSFTVPKPESVARETCGRSCKCGLFRLPAEIVDMTDEYGCLHEIDGCDERRTVKT